MWDRFRWIRPLWVNPNSSKGRVEGAVDVILVWWISADVRVVRRRRRVYFLSLITSFRRNPRSGTEASQMAMLTSLLEDICLPNMLDRWCWSLSGDEEFSVSSARILINDKTLGTVGSKTHWCKHVPLKVNILSWRVKLNNLPTRLNLSRRGMDIQSILCPIL
ncbi:RNA-directed DNA polymerase, eukaryota [Tanacetum coccineum]